MSLVLTPEELVELTGKARPTAQARVLAALGIPFTPRPDGTLVVVKAIVTAPGSIKPREPQLRFT